MTFTVRNESGGWIVECSLCRSFDGYYAEQDSAIRHRNKWMDDHVCPVDDLAGVRWQMNDLEVAQAMDDGVARARVKARQKSLDDGDDPDQQEGGEGE